MTLRIDLHVWNIEEAAEGYAACVTEAEQERAAKFMFEVDRKRFIGARGRLRAILGERAGTAPRDLAFETGSHGKPSLAGGPAFNFSDSAGLGCLAIGGAELLGVDIERKGPRDFAGLAKRYFAAAEQQRFFALSEAGQPDAFYRIWTRKEAFLKAIGTGLATRLDAFEVTMEADEPRMLRIDPSIDPDLPAWSLHALDIAPGFEAALAIRNAGQPVEIVRR
jgi:4'-phosphopantetheinyl transferase